MNDLGIVAYVHGHAIERTEAARMGMLREHQGRRECENAASERDTERANERERKRERDRPSEREILEWRASGNLRSCDRYKRNIFLFPDIII